MDSKPTILGMKESLYNWAFDEMHYNKKTTVPFLSNQLKILMDDFERMLALYGPLESFRDFTDERQIHLRTLCSEKPEMVEVPIKYLLSLLGAHNLLENQGNETNTPSMRTIRD
ncbi:hypothetical protein EBB07_33920 [Paenibacillaceae bacterium]|nr:hypothetical protein EBB07_33920 [Paenibacillaceae bacterium]